MAAIIILMFVSRQKGRSEKTPGQVGSLRAAQYISEHPGKLVDEKAFYALADKVEAGSADDTEERISTARRRMSDNASAVRDLVKIKATLKITLNELETATVPRLKELLLTQGAVLSEPERY